MMWNSSLWCCEYHLVLAAVVDLVVVGVVGVEVLHVQMHTMILVLPVPDVVYPYHWT